MIEDQRGSERGESGVRRMSCADEVKLMGDEKAARLTQMSHGAG